MEKLCLPDLLEGLPPAVLLRVEEGPRGEVWGVRSRGKREGEGSELERATWSHSRAQSVPATVRGGVLTCSYVDVGLRLLHACLKQINKTRRSFKNNNKMLELISSNHETCSL